MSRQYDEYLKNHKENVVKAFRWFQKNLPELVDTNFIPTLKDVDLEHQICFEHDESKFNQDEYSAYDKYFYGGNRSYAVVQEFNYAWLEHIHRNPHHWQHWVLISEDSDDGEIIMDMPYQYIIEMICDWWTFSWRKGNLYEIFDWYDKHKDYIKLSTLTRMEVEIILGTIKEKLDGGGPFTHMFDDCKIDIVLP